LTKRSDNLVYFSTVTGKPATPSQPPEKSPGQCQGAEHTTHRISGAAAHVPFVILQSPVVRTKLFEHEGPELALG
jgi:hypothetical protein